MVRIPFPAACLRLRGPDQGWNRAVEPRGTDYGEDGIVGPASSFLNGPVVLPEIATAIHTYHARVGDADSEVVFLIVTTRRAATSPVFTGVAHDPRVLGVRTWVLHGPDVLANLVLRSTRSVSESSQACHEKTSAARRRRYLKRKKL